jgi:16S rRNA processing protein RimM
VNSGARALIEIGGVARAHGIKGEVVIVTHDRDSDTLGNVDTIYIAGVPRKIAHVRGTQRGWLVSLEGVATRTEAELLRGQTVAVERDALALDDEDVLLADLVGCAVRRVDGTPWGEIAAVDVGPMQDRLVIRDGDVERMLPLVDVFVASIDLQRRVVTVDPPEDLPELRIRR